MQNGTSWNNAFSTLQPALAAAQSGDMIWAAAGTYKPTPTANRFASFKLVDGVQLYGGFAGTEMALEQRDPQTNETVLSGDIGVPGLNTDNSYHVVYGKGLGNNTVLDGFVITGGYSYDEFSSNLDDSGAGMLLEGAPGVANSRPLISNCRFERNFAYMGGALCTSWEDPENPGQGKNPVNPVLERCEFRHNKASTDGGAIYLNSPSGAGDTFTMARCTLADNYVFTGNGGGICFNQTANSNSRFVSCVFERDTSFGGLAGAIYYPPAPLVMNTSSLVLDSCIIRKNISTEGTGLFYNGHVLNPGDSGVQFFCRINHCCFEGNKSKNSSGSAYQMLASRGGKITAEITDCVFTDNLSGNYTTTIGAVYSSEVDVHIERCVFMNNYYRNSTETLCMAVHTGTSGGSAINKATTRINNCLFAHNGGGVAVHSGQKNYVTANITNCTFYDNNEYIFVHSWDTLYNQPNGYHNDLFIDNCIVWEPGTDIVKMFYNNDPDNFSMFGYHINHTLLSLQDSTGVAGSLQAFGDGLLFDQYPEFKDTAAGDFRLEPCSPAVNKGNNLPTLDAGLQVDLDSFTRIKYGIVDMGAYEQQDSCDTVFTSEINTFSTLYLWPNPSVSGVLHIQTTKEFPLEGRFRVFNSSGREVYAQNMTLLPVNNLDLRYLHAGLYQIRFETSVEIFTGKWLKL